MGTRCFVGIETPSRIPSGIEYITINKDGYYDDPHDRGVGDKLGTLITQNEVRAFIRQGNRWTFEDVISTYQGCITAIDAETNHQLQLGKSTSKCDDREALIQKAIDEGVPYIYVFSKASWQRWRIDLSASKAIEIETPHPQVL